MAVKKNLPSAPFDIVSESLKPQHMLVIVFTQSTSPAYPMAIELARGAFHYGAVPLGKKTVHGASFGKTREQAARASALLKVVIGWKGTQVLTQAGGADPYHILSVLDCYQQSLSVSDQQSHCHVVHLDVYRSKETHYMVPCRHLQGWFHSVIEEQVVHPSKLTTRTEALGVRKGCAWCPNFDPSKARVLTAAEKTAIGSEPESADRALKVR